MAAGILTQDILAICLILCNGDTSMDLETIVGRAENYQEETDRHFGLTKYDFRQLFRVGLFYHEKSISLPSCEEIRKFRQLRQLPAGSVISDDVLERVQLKEVIPDILGYAIAWFNDEGEYWHLCYPDREPFLEEYKQILPLNMWDYSDKELHQKIELKQQMKAFFADPDNHHIEFVRRFMKEYGIDESLLVRFSEPGEGG